MALTAAETDAPFSILPSDASELLRSLGSAHGYLQFLAFILPGLVAILIYDLRVPGERRKYTEIVFALIAYSGVLDFFGWVLAAYFPKLSALLFVGLVDVIVPTATSHDVIRLIHKKR